MISIREKYFIKTFLRIFCLFLFCFYGLYVLIDYASHISSFTGHTNFQKSELFRYYLFVFSTRAEILIPIALLIATIKTLISFNIHGELIAFLASGFTKKELLRPLLMIGFLFTILIFLNEEFILPHAVKTLRKFEDSTKHLRSKNRSGIMANHLLLDDGTNFIFQSYDTAKEEFFDVYWIRSIHDIYRIQYLSSVNDIPHGHFVDHLIRQPNGELILQASFTSIPLPGLRFNSELLQSTIFKAEMFSFSEMLSDIYFHLNDLSEKESKMMSAFLWKLIVPWLCVLAILFPSHWCMNFSRQFPAFLIYMGSIFGFIAFYLFLDATKIIAERQVVHPLWAIGIPFIGMTTFFGLRYKNL